jgi:4,5-DOPA dioxygenase extradiol
MNTQPQADASRSQPMPVLFVGHGSPMNAIEDNEFSQAWARLAASLPTPRAILCISAHWETPGTQVTAMARPRTIHDFYGFPEALYQVQYPAPGAPDLARRTKQLVHLAQVELDERWGLDHGTWSVLRRMYPQADVPTYQMSLDYTRDGAGHYALAHELRPLRDEGVLVIGSGNVVHNLAAMRFNAAAYDWAIEFDRRVQTLLLAHDHQALIDYPGLGPSARWAVPTSEHYLPLLYAIALQDPDEAIAFPIGTDGEPVIYGSISMRALAIGTAGKEMK